MKRIIPFVIFFISLTTVIAQVAGTVDETFLSGNGTSNPYGLNVIRMQADGKYLIAGNFKIFQDIYANSITRLNSDFSPDNSFSAGEGVGSDIEQNSKNQIYTVAIQPDGKILVGGYFQKFAGVVVNNIARLNANGSLDATFNAGGTGTTTNTYVNEIAVQPDGKIIIAGSFTTYNGVSKNRIVRVNTDGTIDPTFSIGSGASGTIYEVELQSDNKIIIAGGFTTYNGTSSKYIARLNTNGSYDATYTVGTGANGFIYSTALTADGKLLVGGPTTYNGAGVNGLFRLNTNGTIDNTFTSLLTGSSFPGGVVAAADNKVFIYGGIFKYNGVNQLRYLRLNSDGTTDMTFAHNGPMSSGYYNDVIALNDGKIVMAGALMKIQNTMCFNVALINNDGTLNSTIADGNNGLFNHYGVNKIVQQPDGKYLIAPGKEWEFDLYYDFTKINSGIIRLQENGDIDATFNPGINAHIPAMAIQSDGKILVATQKFNVFPDPPVPAYSAIRRLNADGSLDPTFDTTAHNFEMVTKMFALPDGKIFVSGRDKVTGKSFKRLNANGTVDVTFNAGLFFTCGLGTCFNTVNDFFVQPDGRIVIVQNGYTMYGPNNINNIFRIYADGTIDPTFEDGVSPAIGASYNSDVKFLMMEDGSLISGGYTYMTGGAGGEPLPLIRINPGGTQDLSFHSAVDPEIDGFVEDFTITADGKIFLVAHRQITGTDYTTLYLLNNDGTLDPSFTPGARAYEWDAAFEVLECMIDNNNNLMLGGRFYSVDHFTRRGITRIHTDDPVCVIPDGLSSDHITSVKADLHWNEVYGTSNYKIFYRPSAGGTWIKKKSSVNSKTIIGLTPSTMYDFKISAKCPFGSSAFSTVSTFTTLPPRIGEVKPASAQLYPNPASGNFNIELNDFTGEVLIELFDGNGRLINHEIVVVQNPQTVYKTDASAYKGLVFVKITSQSACMSLPLLLE